MFCLARKQVPAEQQVMVQREGMIGPTLPRSPHEGGLPHGGRPPLLGLVPSGKGHERRRAVLDGHRGAEADAMP
jgi:hypothetical protein